ncbi:MAG: hypothetical protein AAGJ94_15295 [Pseudomonadota bacterium]
MDETLKRRVGLRREEDPFAFSKRAPAVPISSNLFHSDPVLTACLDATLDQDTEDDLMALGAYWGSAEAQEVARIAVKFGPSWRRDDDDGERVDQIDLHPAYHALLNRSVQSGLLSSAWEDSEVTRQHRLRAATLLFASGCERGHLLPVTSTHAAIASLAYAPDLEGELFPLIAARRYDRRPIHHDAKDSVLITLAIAERQQGADRSVITTRGELTAGDSVRITGEKTNVAAPSCDMALVLAKTADGPTVAMVPRYAPDNRDAVVIDGMCRKGGLDAQAFATLSFRDARGHLVGEPGRGLQVLRDVRTLTQLDLTIITAGAVRGALTKMADFLRAQTVGSGSGLTDPQTARLVADLALTSAAQTALAIRLAAAFDQAFERDGDHAVARVLTPASRIFGMKSAALLLTEVRDTFSIAAADPLHPVSRIPRDLVTLAHWDSSAEDAARDLVALITRDETVLSDALDELGADLGSQNADLIDRTAALGREAIADPGLARALAEQLAMVGAASAMRRNLPRVVADAFMSSRLRGGYTAQYGTLDSRFDPSALIEFIVAED